MPQGLQEFGKGAGGRRPKALKSGHRARRAQGMAVAKRYAGPLSLAAALLKPSQVNLFTQGFPPGPAACRRTLFSCSGAAFLLFQHVKLVGTDGAPRGLQEGSKRALRGLQRSLLITSYHRCSWFYARKKHMETNNTKRQLSPVFLCNR